MTYVIQINDNLCNSNDQNMSTEYENESYAY